MNGGADVAAEGAGRRDSDGQIEGQAPPVPPRTAPARGTRELLLATAERLFAERGVHAVSNRQIGEAAGQGNNTAVSYHFGSKQELVRAIMRQHSEAIDVIRARLIAAIRDPEDLREWVVVAVRSVTEHLEGLGRPSWYARFVAQITADPALHQLDTEAHLAAAPSLRRLREGMAACLPDLPEELGAARGTMTRHLITQTTVDRERQLAEHPETTPGSWEDTADALIEAILAIWRAPAAGDASSAERRGSPTGSEVVWPPSAESEMLGFARRMREEFSRFMMEYRFAVDEVLTKVTILREEFLHLHRYNPIEHVVSRVKTPASILEKVARKGVEPSLPTIRERITDIAGIRITCSFIADTYRLLDALTSQDDIRVIEVKDYIAAPKSNGYKSLHAIIEIPVFLSTGAVPVIVEVQIRTIAMDFWASLEHKIFYKYDGEVPDHLAADLADAAAVAEQLDQRMEQLHAEVHGATESADAEPASGGEIDETLLRRLWELSRPPGDSAGTA